MSARKPTVAADGTIHVAENRRARMRYTVEDTLEVGVMLTGSEVKSIRAGKVEIGEAWGQVISGELHLLGAYVAPWAFASAFGHEPRRVRKLLAHKEEIEKLDQRMRQRGYTLIPMRVYFKAGKVKLELALCKGKEGHDRREEIKTREGNREARAAIVRGREA